MSTTVQQLLAGDQANLEFKKNAFDNAMNDISTKNIADADYLEFLIGQLAIINATYHHVDATHIISSVFPVLLKKLDEVDYEEDEEQKTVGLYNIQGIIRYFYKKNRYNDKYSNTFEMIKNILCMNLLQIQPDPYRQENLFDRQENLFDDYYSRDDQLNYGIIKLTHAELVALLRRFIKRSMKQTDDSYCPQLTDLKQRVLEQIPELNKKLLPFYIISCICFGLMCLTFPALILLCLEISSIFFPPIFFLALVTLMISMSISESSSHKKNTYALKQLEVIMEQCDLYNLSEAPAPEEGEAPAPEEGEAPAPEEGEAPAPEEGEAPAPEEGEASALEEGKASALEEGKASALEEGKASALEEGKASALEEGKASALEEGEPPPVTPSLFLPAKGKASAPEHERENENEHGDGDGDGDGLHSANFC